MPVDALPGGNRLPRTVTGAEAFALGALDAGVQLVTGYPGSPATATVEAFFRFAREAEGRPASASPRVEWATNEKSAFDVALGSSLAGTRALICVKSVGLNVALDSLMVANLSPGDGGLVILVGDDPGGWGSQNEEDSRPLASAAELPLVEPTQTRDIRPVMAEAFRIAEEYRLPVVVRTTRALVQSVLTDYGTPSCRSARPPCFQRQGNRFNVLPVHVVDYHGQLQGKLRALAPEFERWPWNGEAGSGSKGIIAAGYARTKLAELIGTLQSRHPRTLHLSTLHPLPEERIIGFLRPLKGALVLEETLPYVEKEIQALAQREGLVLPILGRSTGHVPSAGELFSAQLARALSALDPAYSVLTSECAQRDMPSTRRLCDDCPYIPVFETLLSIMEDQGGRDAFIVTGETGCMVRSQLPPWQLLDVKYGMGSSIGLASGLARSGLSQRVVALAGDSALLHSGLPELVDAVQASARVLVVVLANGTTALSGGQPHAATPCDGFGQPRVPLVLADLVRATGLRWLRVVDPHDKWSLHRALLEGLAHEGVAVVIAEGPCPRAFPPL